MYCDGYKGRLRTTMIALVATRHNVFFALAFLPDFTPEIAVFGGKVGYPLML